ncbi:SH3 domain-containing protein [Streptomyces albicerus]|jgi:hypothetical protein|uniref:SH3 domain-containing protein n=1 Tax=Streptomyces albicerus TaxID=2569859 RepID=UPI00124B5A48|nr:SH3 domain-containing protein [Streptomyces albicerus]
MRYGKHALRGLVAAATALGVVGVASSSAQAAEFVTTYEAVNVREAPTTKSAKIGTHPAGHTLLGVCYQFGETIRDNGVVNDIWVATGKKGGNGWAFISAVYLKGDKYGGLDPVRDWCGHV